MFDDNTMMIDVTITEPIEKTITMKTIYQNSVVIEISDYIIHSFKLPFLVDDLSQFEIYYENKKIVNKTLEDILDLKNIKKTPHFVVKVRPFTKTLNYPLGLVLTRERTEDNEDHVVWIEKRKKSYIYCFIKKGKPTVKELKHLDSSFMFSDVGKERLDYLKDL